MAEQVSLLINAVDGHEYRVTYAAEDARRLLKEFADGSTYGTISVPGGFIAMRHVVRLARQMDKPPPQPTDEPGRR